MTNGWCENSTWWENTSIDLIVLSYRLCVCGGKNAEKPIEIELIRKQSSIFMFAI